MKSWRIGRRLGIGFGVGVVFLVAVGWLSLRGMAAMNASLQTIANERSVVVRLTDGVLQRSIDNARITMQLFVVSGGPAEQQLLAQNLENTKLISAGVENIEKLLSTESEKALFYDVKTLRTPYLESRAEVKKRLAAGERDAAITMANGEMIPRLTVYRAAWNRFLAAQNDSLNAAVAEGTARYRATRAMTLLLIALAALAASLIGVTVTRRVTTPILDLTRTVQRVSTERDYSLRVEHSTSDELGVLADGFNGMLGKIQEQNVAVREAHDLLDVKVKERTHDLESTNARLGAANDELSAATARANETAEALRASNQLIEGVINAIPVRVFWKDTSLVYLGCNAAFARDAGFADPKDIIGKDDFQMGWRDQAKLYRADDRHVIESGRAKGLIEEPQQTPEGRTITLLTSKLPLRGSKGEVSGVLGTYMDITEHKRAEEALRASEQRTRAILDNMLGGLIMVDPAGRIELVNPAAERMIGYTNAELAGKYLGPLLSLPSGADPQVFLRELIGKSLGKVTELEGKRKNGEIFPIELSLFQVDTPEGRRFAGSIVDVTERRALDRLKREFVSSISHELRTPLTSIRGSLGLLAGGVLGPLSPDAVEIVAVAERNVLRLIGLINDILDLERLEGGRLEMEFESCDAAAIVEQSLESVRSFATQSKIALAVDPVSASVRVRGDADRLVQVLVNLLSNAVKFSTAGGTVTVRVVLGAALAEFQVEDRGRGVPPALREAIFERYRQVEASDSRRKGGVGLGLSICKAIVERHGGAIGVRDPAGTGSLFWFRIPLVSMHRPSLSGTIKGAKGIALLVDDDEELLAILELRLAQDRVATQRATTAGEAIAAAFALKPDVIVLDLGLPDGDGSQVVDALRNDKDLSKIPLLIYTGRDLRQEDRDRLVLGPTRYLTKSREAEDEFRSVVLELLAEGERKPA